MLPGPGLQDHTPNTLSLTCTIYMCMCIYTTCIYMYIRKDTFRASTVHYMSVYIHVYMKNHVHRAPQSTEKEIEKAKKKGRKDHPQRAHTCAIEPEWELEYAGWVWSSSCRGGREGGGGGEVGEKEREGREGREGGGGRGVGKRGRRGRRGREGREVREGREAGREREERRGGREVGGGRGREGEGEEGGEGGREGKKGQ